MGPRKLQQDSEGQIWRDNRGTVRCIESRDFEVLICSHFPSTNSSNYFATNRPSW